MTVTSIATKNTGFLMAAGAAALPKAVGSLFRCYDDRNAPWAIKKDTFKREALTVAQVSLYGAAIQRGVKGLEKIATSMSQKGESNLFAEGLQKLQSNPAIFLLILMCTANFIAEVVSRIIAPRNIWNKPNSQQLIQLENTTATVPHIDICGELYAAKGQPLFKANAQRKPQPLNHQPVSFSNRPAPAVVANPFQVATPPVARSPFSV